MASKEILKKLSDIQAELFVPKGQKNNFGGYNYRSCEDILKAVKPLIEKKGCLLHMTNDLEHIGDFNYIKATVYITDVETGDFIASTAYAREEPVKKGMDGSQISGSSTSYARKYALAGLFCIDNEKDSDATNTHGKDVEEDAKAEGLSQLQIDAILAELERTGVTEDMVLSSVGKPTLASLTNADYIKVTKKLAKTATKEN